MTLTLKKPVASKKKVVKTSITSKSNPVSLFRPKIRSRHNSHDNMRTMLPKLPFTSVIRFGSTTPCEATVQINLPESIMNSADKLKMKHCFTTASVKTAIWIAGTNSNKNEVVTWASDKFPIVTKSRFGSRGRGNSLIKTSEEFTQWLQSKSNLSNYIFEKYYNYNREYRLHVTENGCFYTCRKVLLKDTPEDQRWFRNDSNSNWIIEENELFDKPINWEAIVSECVKALKSCNLDFGACDVRVQSAKTQKDKIRENPDFIIVEINSAPSFGDTTQVKYLEMLPELIKNKYSNQLKKK